jgi:hypothetical protein
MEHGTQENPNLTYELLLYDIAADSVAGTGWLPFEFIFGEETAQMIIDTIWPIVRQGMATDSVMLEVSGQLNGSMQTKADIIQHVDALDQIIRQLDQRMLDLIIDATAAQRQLGADWMHKVKDATMIIGSDQPGIGSFNLIDLIIILTMDLCAINDLISESVRDSRNQ